LERPGNKIKGNERGGGKKGRQNYISIIRIMGLKLTVPLSLALSYFFFLRIFVYFFSSSLTKFPPVNGISVRNLTRDKEGLVGRGYVLEERRQISKIYIFLTLMFYFFNSLT
jgi:hypothetical protein